MKRLLLVLAVVLVGSLGVATLATGAGSELVVGTLSGAALAVVAYAGLFTFVGQYTTEWGYIMAAGVLTCLPALVFFFLLQRALTRGLIAGAMKG